MTRRPRPGARGAAVTLSREKQCGIVSLAGPTSARSLECRAYRRAEGILPSELCEIAVVRSARARFVTSRRARGIPHAR